MKMAMQSSEEFMELWSEDKTLQRRSVLQTLKFDLAKGVARKRGHCEPCDLLPSCTDS